MSIFNKIGMVIGDMINVVKRTNKMELIGKLTVIGIAAELVWHVDIINWTFYRFVTDILEISIMVTIIIWIVETIRSRINKK